MDSALTLRISCDSRWEEVWEEADPEDKAADNSLLVSEEAIRDKACGSSSDAEAGFCL